MTRIAKTGAVFSAALIVVVVWTAGTTAGKDKQPAATTAQADTAKTTPADTARAVSRDTVKQFTLEELATCDGKEGRPAYIAVDGAVYDVAKAKGWKNGQHQGFKAGRDVTKDMQKKSPHGVKPLTKLPKVGVLAKPAAAPAPAE